MTRRGVTLLELLMALSMLVMLLGIVWSITIILFRTETRRVQQADQQRVARSWTQILSNDFQSAIQDTEQLNKAEGDETIRHFGVSGIATQLRIDVTDYSWRTTESSELRTIFYDFHAQSGLVRRERDYATLKSVDGTIQLAPEIVSGQFRYFDGRTWHEQWSSLDHKSAPSAIEVTFHSLPRAEATRWRNQEVGVPKPEMYRDIVQISVASQGIHESYQRAQPPQQNNPPPRQPAPPPPPPSTPPPSPFHSFFDD